MAVVLDNDLGILVLDHLGELAEERRLADARHVLEADFLSAGSDELVGNAHIVFERVYGRVGDAECALRSHSALLRPLDGRDDVAHVVQTVEDTGDVGALLRLHLVHEGAHVVGHGIHAKSVQTTVEHVGLDAHLVEGLAEGADSLVGVLAREKVHLLEGTAIGLYTAEAAHLNDDGGNLSQLILAWLELTGALPHVSIDETELNFLLHYFLSLFFLKINAPRGKARPTPAGT